MSFSNGYQKFEIHARLQFTPVDGQIAEIFHSWEIGRMDVRPIECQAERVSGRTSVRPSGCQAERISGRVDAESIG